MITVSKEVDWCRENEVFIGPSAEIAEFYNDLAAAVRSGWALFREESEQIAKIAYQAQLDSIVWLYVEDAGDIFDPREFGLPSLSDATGILEETCGWAPDYGGTDANEFAEWILSKHDWEVAQDYFQEQQINRLQLERKRREERKAT